MFGSDTAVARENALQLLQECERWKVEQEAALVG